MKRLQRVAWILILIVGPPWQRRKRTGARCKPCDASGSPGQRQSLRRPWSVVNARGVGGSYGLYEDVRVVVADERCSQSARLL